MALFECEMDVAEIMVQAEVVRTSKGHPGRMCGPPEDCYPPEPAEYAILGWYYESGPISLDRLLAVTTGLSLEERNKAIAEVEEQAMRQADDHDWQDGADPDQAYEEWHDNRLEEEVARPGWDGEGCSDEF